MKKIKRAYRTSYGEIYSCNIEEFIDSSFFRKYEKKVRLIFTSPPFPLNRKKKYGNLNGEEYLIWLTEIISQLKRLLMRNGSLVIELGNSWEPGLPVMSTLSLKALLNIKESGNFFLCQNFIWYNTAKLPTPAQWVNIDRIRVKDSFTNIWWMSRSSKPFSNNRNVIIPYSNAMNKLIESGKYNAGRRPSEHVINEKTFLKDNKGAIPSNVLIGANTSSSSDYLRYCKKNNIYLHPARMPDFIPEFFIKFLTKDKDIIFDPFAGSNTTGSVAEKLNRKWLSVEQNEKYILGSIGRFKTIRR